MSVDNFISKEQTLVVKGLAIFFMVAHHCLIKEFFIAQPEVLTTMPAVRLQISMKICVGLFTFFVGYVAYYSERLDFRYFISHCVRLLKQYWIVLFGTVLLCMSFGEQIKVRELLLGLIGLSPYYNLGNWYIYFYIYALLILPVIAYLVKKNTTYSTLAIIILAYTLSFLISGESITSRAMHDCLQYTPILCFGYVCAKTQVFVRWSGYVRQRFVWLLLALFAILLRSVGLKGISTDIVSVPLFILAICNITSWGGQILQSLGRNSTLMWFIHAIPLSSASGRFFQESDYWINNPILLFVALVAISYLMAIVLNKLMHKIGYL